MPLPASDRSSNPHRPLKPSLASSRTARSPVIPRVAANATPSIRSTASQPTSSVRSEPPTPRVKQTSTPMSETGANGNITPRSSTRTSKAASANDSPSGTTRPKLLSVASNEKSNGVAKLEKAQVGRPRSLIAGNEKTHSPLIRSPILSPLPLQSTGGVLDAQFFHASDAPKQEPALKKPEPQKKAQFFHADGKQDSAHSSLPGASSVLVAVSEQRPPTCWSRLGNDTHASASPPLLSPALSAISSTSPFFAAGATHSARQPSPTQSKENVHLSYRKGASQIFGTRPTPRPRSNASSGDNALSTEVAERTSSVAPSSAAASHHHRSTSLSSIDSGGSIAMRRKSSAFIDTEGSTPFASHDVKTATISLGSRVARDLPSIDTSLEMPGILSRTESGLSPTKPASDFAAEARRERKVLDLEISNSSLLAINASLEREVRRQKSELKRFRRLSRAGRFSFAPGDRIRTLSDDLTMLNEEDENEDDNFFGLPSGSLNQDDNSDDDESLISSTEPLSPSAQDRLAKDERRLRIDLEKHKELLVQSQAMNQSIKRCMYATEDMIKEGRKALDYHVQVSDLQLGGRVLSTYEEAGEHQENDPSDMIVRSGDTHRTGDILEAWTEDDRPSFEGSEAGDRDSGIEVDRPASQSLPLSPKPGLVTITGRPTTLRDMERFGSFS